MDLRVAWRGWDIVGEAILGDAAYVDGKRPGGARGLSQLKQADMVRGGAYGIVGYTISPLWLMPFVGYDYIADPLQIGTSHFCPGGLRFTPEPTVTLKAELLHLISSEGALGLTDYDALRFQFAWTFR